MIVDRVKKDGIDYTFVDVDKHEALELIKSLSSQLMGQPNADRKEFFRDKKYFSIFVK